MIWYYEGQEVLIWWMICTYYLCFFVNEYDNYINRKVRFAGQEENLKISTLQVADGLNLNFLKFSDKESIPITIKDSAFWYHGFMKFFIDSEDEFWKKKKPLKESESLCFDLINFNTELLFFQAFDVTIDKKNFFSSISNSTSLIIFVLLIILLFLYFKNRSTKKE